jgi:GNAT superfamily N-acetyltransferase
MTMPVDLETVANVERATASAGATVIRDTVTTLGTERLIMSRSIDPANLRRLLQSLAREDCAHSWKNFGLDGTLERLLQWENELRPTEIFFFYLEDAQERRLVAAGAIADRLNRRFPHPGFCVLGRCYVMPESRGHGLYRRVLHQRLEYCRARFGDTLNAVHIGSDNERVGNVVTNHRLAGWPHFTHLGQEALQVAGRTKLVNAYLLFLPEYLWRLRRTLAGAHAPSCVVEMRNALAGIESGEARNLGVVIKERLENAQARRWLDGRDTSELDQLLLLCRSIPLVGFS